MTHPDQNAMNYSEDTRPLSAVDHTSEVFAPIERERRRKRKGPRWLRKLRRRVSGRVRILNLLIIFFAVVLVVGIGSAALATDASNRINASLNSLSRLLQNIRTKPGTELTLMDFNRLESSLTELSGTLAGAGSQLRFLRPFRALNADVDAGFSALAAAQNMADAAREMLLGLQPTLFFLVSGEDQETLTAQISSGERIVELLRIGLGEFVSAQDRLEAARTAIDTIDLSQVSSTLVLQVDALNTYYDQLVQINAILRQSPELLSTALGLTGERTYLVLSQNSDELRPSGGYISTYGWVGIRSGRITDYNYSPTTATSPNPPPAELAAQFPVPSWWIPYQEPIYALWDGSWSADFPTTASMALWYYNEGDNPRSPVDAVIGIDIVGFEYILEALGGVTVPGYEQIVTPDNFRQVIYEVRAQGEGDVPHKRFLAALYQQIFSDWQTQTADPDRNAQVLGQVLRALQEKHIMLYFDDPALNQAVELLGWSGVQSPAQTTDYLMVADANMGNKSNRSILRQLTYDVEIHTDGTLSSRATIAYDYPARVAEQDPAVNPDYHGALDYFNTMQVFVPANSQLESTSNFTFEPTIVPSERHTIFVSLVDVLFDTSERMQLSYVTPPLVEVLGPYRRYQLILQKQPGTLADPVNVQVTLPTGATLISAIPEPVARYTLDRPILEYRFTMNSDQQVELVFSQ